MKRRAPELLGLVLGLVVGVVGAFGQTPTMTVAPGSLQFTMVAGGAAPASQQVMVTSAPNSISYAVFTSYMQAQGQDWLRVTPTLGLSNSSATISVVNSGVLTPGQYTASLTFLATGFGNALATANVTLNVVPPGTGPATLTAIPASLTFQGYAGTSLAAQSLSVFAGTATNMTVSLQTTTGGNWLSVTPASSSGAIGAFTVAVTTTGLAPGAYVGSVRITGNNTTVDVPVVLILQSSGPEMFEPSTISLSGTIGQVVPSTQQVRLTTEFFTSFQVSDVRTDSGGNWLTVSPMSGGHPQTATFTVSANPTGLQPGTYTGSFTALIVGVNSKTIPVTFVASAAPAATTGLRFVPIAPCRMMETRAEYNFAGRTGAFGPPFVNVGGTRLMRPQDSTVCSIPAAAKAYSLNVTLLPRGGPSSVRVSPAGEQSSDLVSTISFSLGEVVANATFVKAGDGGQIAVTTGGAADVLLDVNGYFIEESTAEALVYYPMRPCRVVETRAAYRQAGGPFGPPSLAAGERRTFAFRASPCAVPANARAYAVSLTAVPDGPLAFLSLVPTGGAAPLVSSLNAFGGQVVSNQVIVPAGTNGSIDAFSYGKTDVILDITGYFAPDDGANGLRYYPVRQCRTLTGVFVIEETKTVSIPAERCNWVGPAAKAYTLNATVIPNGPMPFLTMYPTGQARPGTSFLNAFEGQVMTNSVIVPAGANGAVDLYAYRPTQVRVDVLGYFGR